MKKTWILFLIAACIVLVLTGCAESTVSAEPVVSGVAAADQDEDAHSHQLSEGDNVAEHEEAGYCGNTVTTVSCHPGGRENEAVWEKTFEGGESVALTNLLRYLDYSGEICKCLPEYTVDTEFGQGYGINLAQGYVRHNDGQVELTAEQLQEIQGIMDWLSAQP